MEPIKVRCIIGFDRTTRTMTLWSGLDTFNRPCTTAHRENPHVLTVTCVPNLYEILIYTATRSALVHYAVQRNGGPHVLMITSVQESYELPSHHSFRLSDCFWVAMWMQATLKL